MARVYNFNAGPAALPLPVLEKAQAELLDLAGSGMSVMEMSHRSKEYAAVNDEAEANVRKLLGVPDDYAVLFLQGGASLQFAMIPMNLRRPGKVADYVDTGSWASKAIKEAKASGAVNVAWSGKDENYMRAPRESELKLTPGAEYVHICSNETIGGVQFPQEPETGGVPLVCDASSDLLSRPVAIEKYGILFACAQKNAGPAGVTTVIIRDDLVQRSPADLPSMVNYKVLAEGKSLLNTPPTFAVYMVKLVTDWILQEFGGLERMREHNEAKARLLYDAIDRSAGFYTVHAAPGSRSSMNIAFRLPDAAREEKFLKEAAARGLCELKGHRSVGGCRASIYNAMPKEGVAALAEFMQEFQQNNAR